MSSARVLARTGSLPLSTRTTLSSLRPLSKLHLQTTKVSANPGSLTQVSKRTYSSSARGYFTTTVEDGQEGHESEPMALFKPLDTFARRHIGPKTSDANQMLEKLGYASLDEFVKDVVPENILSSRNLNVSPEKGYTESELIARLKEIAGKNVIDKRSFIGTGYYGTITPPVIQRNILETPEWYTSYTPYQPEISQGRLESLINFQTVATDLTGLAIANASVLDEATAAAEAMTMSWGTLPASRQKKPNRTYFVDEKVHPQTLDGLKSRAHGFGITIKVGNALDIAEVEKIGDNLIGVLVQYPSTDGSIHDYSALSEKVHTLGGTVAVATDLLALTLLKPPAEFGADIAFGNAQRFGVPLGYGGPHAAFFATSEKYKRKMPGRLIGLSKDRLGNPAYRLALQTREQHIRREKATSNICTAQALLANMSAMYAVYHGPEGLKQIAKRVKGMTEVVAEGLKKMGYQLKGGAQSEGGFFDTVVVEIEQADGFVKNAAEKFNLNLRKVDDTSVGISLDETVQLDDVVALLVAFKATAPSPQEISTTFLTSLSTTAIKTAVPEKFVRTSSFLTHPVFNSYHSETEMLRYIHHLQSKDLSLAHSMIPLGSCTMKLNATTEMLPITWPEFSNLHPFVPKDQATGYKELIDELEADLADITGFDAVSLQPNSGAQGEFAGLRVIREYLKSTGQGHRDICLIPVSAHGTNPASATMAGLKVVPVKCDSKTGNLDLADLEAKAQKHKDNLAAFMVTYPSTFGVFEPGVKRAIEIVHENGGQVYMDGANMNAQIGLCSPGEIGADVCHLNLHKTFCIPHGGGGPGVGPIGVKSHLAPFLPGHTIIPTGGEHSIPAISSAPWGSASILPISWSYIKLMGARGLTHATKITLLNANYMAAKLAPHYPILYTNTKERCAHEFILDVRPLAQAAGIEAIDIAKRLQDYGFHAPTMSWPVAGTLMIEPTESESKEELDRFCDALIAIREEIREVEEGKMDKKLNVLKMAPHTAQDLLGDWERGYSREKAAYPLPYLRERKFWPSVTRVDDAYGDMNLFCTCSPVDATE